MATSKTLAPTNVTISIPAMTDQPNASVLANCADKEADAINALNSNINAMFTVFKTVAYGQTVSSGTTITIPVETGSGTYMVLVARSDRTKTGVFITDAAGTSELVYCGASVALTSSGITVTNNNAYSMSATVYRLV